MLLHTILLLNVAVATVTSSSVNRPHPFSLPSSHTPGRTAEIEKTRRGFTYGTDNTLVGVNPWPAGPLGRMAIQTQYDAFLETRVPINRFIDQDVAMAQASLNDVSHKHVFGYSHCPH
jgi:hypothetical protein